MKYTVRETFPCAMVTCNWCHWSWLSVNNVTVNTNESNEAARDSWEVTDVAFEGFMDSHGRR